jgi:asparagine synthase (glutamine-hydrolysing)
MGFEEPSFDESEHARRVAALFGTDHHADRLSLEQAVAILPEIAARLDEPLGDNSLLPTYLLSGSTRRHVTVALGGDGGDELFAGYDPFRALQQAERYRRLTPRPVHQAIRMLAARLPVSHRNMSFDFKVKRFLRGMDYPPKLWLPFWMAPLEPAEIAELFHEPADPEEIFAEAIAAWESPGPPDLVSRAIQFYVKIYLQDDILVKIDRASMLHGLEVRAPFLDIELVDFVRKIPSAWKYRGGVTKYILKKALEPLLPPEVLHRKKKGFGAPVGAWLQTGRLDFDSGVWPPGLDEGFLRTQLAEHRSGRADHRALLWNAWMLKQWR